MKPNNKWLASANEAHTFMWASMLFFLFTFITYKCQAKKITSLKVQHLQFQVRIDEACLRTRHPTFHGLVYIQSTCLPSTTKGRSITL